ncbi:hypothetical protein Zmor_010672 [Zophobas morio]|uniref:Uncharacterized protein n=1 Tax=Zophobas morio TaxID=2755281 RepID=A0AA38IP41_9CUCU|nr:hypothetical protein Zmor_010672 [Zophobas morio]
MRSTVLYHAERSKRLASASRHSFKDDLICVRGVAALAPPRGVGTAADLHDSSAISSISPGNDRYRSEIAIVSAWR